MRIVDIGLIKDEANVAAPRRRPMSENFVEMVDLDQGVDTSTSESSKTTPIDSTHTVSRSPSSSQSAPPSAALVLLARV